MAWINKRKIHVARGTTANIIALDNEENKLFTDGQPLFNKDRGYLGIANGSQEAKYIAPIKVRTIEGWGNEIDSETGSYTLKSDGTGEDSKANHYLFTGDSDGTYLKSDMPLHMNSNSDIYLGNISTNNGIDTFKGMQIFKSSSDTNAAMMLETIQNPQGIIYIADILFGTGDKNVGICKVDYGGRGWSSEMQDTLLVRHAILSGRVCAFGDIQMQSRSEYEPIKLSAYNTGYLDISAPTKLRSTLTGCYRNDSNNDVTTLSITPSTGSIDAKSLKITSVGSSANVFSANKTVSICGSGSTASLYVTFSSIKANSSIDATGQTITCGALNVSSINIL